MAHELVTLENEYWQVGILPGTGASIAFARVKRGGEWVDVMRPTAEADYGNPSNCASFIMAPWCNRIRDGKLVFDGQTYQLATTPDDGTARHGDVRKRVFTVVQASQMFINTTLDSRTQATMNWPFAFRLDVDYALDDAAFVWELALTNLDARPFPAGFGHHPYFVRPSEQPMLQIPCDRQFNLVNAMAVAAPVPVTPRLDFRQPRALDDAVLDDLLTGRIGNTPVHLTFPEREVTLEFHADRLFPHWIVYAPTGKPYFAVEPMTNASDGFNLYDKGISGSGVFVLQPGETAFGMVALRHLDP